MLLFEPAESPYDLRFNLLGIPVRVHPMFWLVTFVMGGPTAQNGFEYLLIWIGCVFVSILIHELGHVITGNFFGSYGHIVLYGFGGLAIGSNRLAKRWQRIVVLFMGPGAEFLLLAAVLTGIWLWDPEAFGFYIDSIRGMLGLRVRGDFAAPLLSPILTEIVFDLVFINLIWALLNLLPIWPLDGGQITRELFTAVSPENGAMQSLAVSIGVAALFAIHSLLSMRGQPLLPIPIGGSWFTVLFFGMFAVQSWQDLQRMQAERRWMHDHWDDEKRW